MTTTEQKFQKIDWDYSIGNPYADEIPVFSLFKTAKTDEKIKDISIDEYIKLVQDFRKKDTFLKLRSLPIPEYKTEKGKTLGAITGSCIVSKGHAKDQITALNGLFVVDFDELPDSFNTWADFKEALAVDEYSYLLHYSASGRGLCMFVKIPTENDFQEIYNSLEKYFFEKYRATIDELKNENRLRFISYDPEVISNQSSLTYTEIEKVVLSEVKPYIKKDRGTTEKTPAEAFNESGSDGLNLVNNVLQSCGWIISNGYGKNIFNYRHSPEASPKSMVCLEKSGVILFCVYSTSTGLKKQPKAGKNYPIYTLYDLYSELNSFKEFEASEKLASLGFGKWNAKKETSAKSKISDMQDLQENDFPIHAFPASFRAYTIDLKNTLNFPIDYTATSILTAVSTALGTNVCLRVKDGWFELPSIYTCLVGNPGANKTHPINTAFKPLKDKDKFRQENFEIEYNNYLRYEKLSKKEKADAPEVKIPKLEKSVLNNFTTEILYKRLQENERGCAVVSDEIISFFEGMNNYSKTDQIGIYLSFWNNQPTTIDRVSTPIPLFIVEPYLSIIGGLQINALPKAFPIDKINNGFLQRFLFAFPDNAIKHPINNNSQNDELKRNYESYISDCYQKRSKSVLKFSNEAKEYFYNWQRINCDCVNENQDTVKGEIYSKFDNHFLRLAILLQMMKDIESTEIQIEAAEGAASLCNYFINTAFKVIAKIQSPESYLETLPRNKKDLYKELLETFTTGQAVEIGEKHGVKTRTVKEFLKDSFLFINTKHGEYQKIVKETIIKEK